MKTKVIVIGGKGTAVVVAEHVHDANLRGADVEFLGYAFDDPSFGKEINGFPILCGTHEVNNRYSQYPDVKFIFQMYRSDLFQERIALKESYGISKDKFFTFIHPSAVVLQSVTVGAGSVIMANVVIMPNVVLGDHCTILAGCTIGHDTQLGDHNFFATHVVMGSNCKIGNANFFGMNSTVNTKAVIGDHCFIGMATNVVKDLSTGSKVFGNPAKPFDGPVKPL